MILDYISRKIRNFEVEYYCWSYNLNLNYFDTIISYLISKTMGGKIQGVISNATEWQLKYTIRETMLQTSDATVTTDWNVGGKVNG